MLFIAMPSDLPVHHPVRPPVNRRYRIEAERLGGRREGEEESALYGQDVLAGLVINMAVDEGRITLHAIKGKEAWIEAAWPHCGNAMLLALSRMEAYGFTPIPEEDSPAEVQANGRVRIYCEEGAV